MAKEFVLIADTNPTIYRNVRISSQAYSIGDVVQLSRSAYDVTPATSATINADIFGVAMEAVAATATTLLVCEITRAQIWAADVNATASASHNFQRMILTDKGTVNNTGTDSASSAAVFTQIAPITTSRVSGRFNVGASVS